MAFVVESWPFVLLVDRLGRFRIESIRAVRERRKGWIRKYEYSASKKLRRFLREAFFERPREREMVAYKQREDTLKQISSAGFVSGIFH